MNISFGTKIIVQDVDKQRDELNQKFSDKKRKTFYEPMSSHWVQISKMPSIKLEDVKNKHYVRNKSLMNGIYKITRKVVNAETKDIDICSGGIVIGNNGNVGMFHIAPTLDNYDLLLDLPGWNKDYLGNSIDCFSKSAGGIKKAIIVGGKNIRETRGALSMTVNKIIRKKFIDRDIPTTVLSDMKDHYCDLFYSSAKDELKVGVSSRVHENLREAFGEVVLQDSDTIELKTKK